MMKTTQITTIFVSLVLLAAPGSAGAQDALSLSRSSGSASHDTGVSERSRENPTVALELAASGAISANPYLQHQGWEFETGPASGLRAQFQLVGLVLGYEYTTMGNTEVCGSGCFEGDDFGRTTFHAAELGYRLRFAAGPVRPFLEFAVGGLIANSGDWSEETAESVYGGMARGAVGVEYPFGDRFFASGYAGYRLIATETPLRNQAEDELNTTFMDIDPSAGDYAEDAHLVTFGVGIGVEL